MMTGFVTMRQDDEGFTEVTVHLGDAEMVWTGPTDDDVTGGVAFAYAQSLASDVGMTVATYGAGDIQTGNLSRCRFTVS